MKFEVYPFILYSVFDESAFSADNKAHALAGEGSG